MVVSDFLSLKRRSRVGDAGQFNDLADHTGNTAEMARHIVVTGATGLLGQTLMGLLRSHGYDPTGFSLFGRQGTVAGDIADRRQITARLDRVRPDYVFHLAAIARPQACEAEPQRAWSVNVEATDTIADWCRRNDSGLLFTSSDWVFDGDDGPYDEDRPARPATAYGRTKLAAEAFCTTIGAVARLSLLRNDVDYPRPDFLQSAIERMQRGETVTAAADEWRSPLVVSRAAAALVALATRDYRGIIHVGGEQSGTPLEFLREAAAHGGFDPELAIPISRSVLGPANRPRDVRLDSRRLQILMQQPVQAADVPLGIVIPVYNGAHCLGGTLAALATQTRPGMAVAVIVNGSTDASAEIARQGLALVARTGADTTMLELPRASRAKALDAGDAAIGDRHRLYIDQDAVVSHNALADILVALQGGAGFVGARAEWRGGTPLVRAAMAAWNALPYVQRSPATAGTYAVSAAGRRRWSSWPEAIPDDKFARLHFRPAERRRLPDVVYGVEAPTDFSGLVAARRRYRRFNAALRTAYPELTQNDLDRGPVNLAGLSLRNLPGLSVLLAAHLLAWSNHG